ncbi:hypothetical protein ES703_32080 [subsurface metagenome]
MRQRFFFLILLILLAAAAAAQTKELNEVLGELNGTLQWNPISGVGYIDVNEGAASWSALAASSNMKSVAFLQEASGRVIFKINSPWVIIDYHHLLTTPGIKRQGGAVLFPEVTVKAIKEYFKRKAEQDSLPRVAVILIDPGHGGKDPGAIGFHTVDGKSKKILEKDIVLKVAHQLHGLLRRQFPDKKILLTREDDTYLKLEERTHLANDIQLGEYEAIIFISIHANASLNKKAKGFEVWYLPPDYRRDLINPESLEDENKEIAPILNVLLEEEYTIESITLAREILSGFDRMVGEITENRGIKEEYWFVVRNAKMPSVLIELGFITHGEEGPRLAREDYLQKLTQGIYTGIRNFIQTFENSRGFTE